jgi:hypothetical protein
MTERQVEKRVASQEARDPEKMKLYEPFMFVHDQFGFSVDLSNNQIIIGAPGSSASVTTTWDFEAGLLLGWF